MRVLFTASLLLLVSCNDKNKEKEEIMFSCDYISGNIAYSDRQQSSILESVGATNSFNSAIVDRMVSEIGLSKNFILLPYDGISNAVAINIDGKRFILYNESFMNEVNNASETNWASISIIAHEIGHHLEGHTIENGGSRPSIELSADKFSGFIMYKLGASLEDAIGAISKFGSDSGSRTHPPKQQRIIAITEGYRNAEKKDQKSSLLYDYAYLSNNSWIIHSRFGEKVIRLLANGKLVTVGEGNNKNDYWEIKGDNIFLYFHWDNELDWTYQGKILNPEYIEGGATSFDGRGVDWTAEPGYNN